MKLPVIPILVVLIFAGLVIYLFDSTGSTVMVLDVPKLSRLADVEGVETEVAIAPDGNRLAVISSGDLWLIDIGADTRQRLTRTPDAERFPAWTPDGLRLTFSRGADTHVVDTADLAAEQVFKADATSLTWSSGRIAFVRNKGLWLADPTGLNERLIVEPHADPDMTIRSPRFSPDSTRLAFIRTLPGIRGELWTVDVLAGTATPLVADRPMENPLDVAWLSGGRNLGYLTDRSGSYAVWFIDTAEDMFMPLTAPLVGMPLADIGIGVWQDRIVVPRHFVDSDIVWEDGAPIIATDAVEFEPALSADGNRLAYTVARENKFEIWTADISGENAQFRTLGREPRFAPNGFQLVYTHTNLLGNSDLWRIDLRDNSSEELTDADELDLNPDWSPDGRSIVFSSSRGGKVSIWTIATSGGKRLRLNDSGYAPRFSPDGRQILFWDRNALWTMGLNGERRTLAQEGVEGPVAGVWTRSGPQHYRTLDVAGDRPIWPAVDVNRDGRLIIAPIETHATELWALDLTYKPAEP